MILLETIHNYINRIFFFIHVHMLEKLSRYYADCTDTVFQPYMGNKKINNASNMNSMEEHHYKLIVLYSLLSLNWWEGGRAKTWTINCATSTINKHNVY